MTCPAIRLCAEGVAHGGVAEVVPRSGTHVTPWEPVVRWWGDPLPDDVVAQVRGTIEVGLERTFSQDPVFGVRQLVDVAERALSPSTNDPATAVQVVQQLHVVLGEFVAVEQLSPFIHDELGRALPTFAGLLEEACDRLDTLMDDARPAGLTG
nr:DUF2254 family protein [Jonesia denitrificans]